ncbi:MAG: hypothetical protein CMO74_10775 [Verrucomicrobiales bacterium]|nr:hypothetical protein [Verrucomicrobiales bacterium]
MLKGVTGDTFVGMEQVSIKELHARTGQVVRNAGQVPVLITERGKVVAQIGPAQAQLNNAPFPKRAARSLPATGQDSTSLISADRDGR